MQDPQLKLKLIEASKKYETRRKGLQDKPSNTAARNPQHRKPLPPGAVIHVWSTSRLRSLDHSRFQGTNIVWNANTSSIVLLPVHSLLQPDLISSQPIGARPLADSVPSGKGVIRNVHPAARVAASSAVGQAFFCNSLAMITGSLSSTNDSFMWLHYCAFEILGNWTYQR